MPGFNPKVNPNGLPRVRSHRKPKPEYKPRLVLPPATNDQPPEDFSPYKHCTFSPVPDWLECRPVMEISQGAKLCYGRLMRYAGRDDHCFAGLDKLSKALGVKVRQTRDYLNELLHHKLIRKARGGRKTNTYYFLRHPWQKNNRQDSADQKSKSSPQRAFNRQDSADQQSPQNQS